MKRPFLMTILSVIISALFFNAAYAGTSKIYSDRNIMNAACGVYRELNISEIDNSFSVLSGRSSAPDYWRVINEFDDRGTGGSGLYCCTIDTADGNCIIAYRGSEGFEDTPAESVNNIAQDWILADFGLTNSGETTEQHAAERYTQYIFGKIGADYEWFTLVGHSLGGNLAEHAAITAPDEMKKKCNAVSLDGPGFSSVYLYEREKEINKLRGKLSRRTWTVVGILLGTPVTEDYMFIDVPSGVHTDYDGVVYDSHDNFMPGDVYTGEKISHVISSTFDWIARIISDISPLPKWVMNGGKENVIALGKKPEKSSVWVGKVIRNGEEKRIRVPADQIVPDRENAQNASDPEKEEAGIYEYGRNDFSTRIAYLRAYRIAFRDIKQRHDLETAEKRGNESDIYDDSIPYNSVSFTFCDITGDGIKELIAKQILAKHATAIWIYSLKDGIPYLMGETGGDTVNCIVAGYAPGYIFESGYKGSYSLVYREWNGTEFVDHPLYEGSWDYWGRGTGPSEPLSFEELSDYYDETRITDYPGDWCGISDFRFYTEEHDAPVFDGAGETTLYKPVLDMYVQSIGSSWSILDGNGTENPNDPDSVSYKWPDIIDDLDTGKAGYMLRDLNHDGIPELIMSTGRGAAVGTIMDLYTVFNNQVIHLASHGGTHYSYYLGKDDLVMNYGFAGSVVKGYSGYRIVEGQLSEETKLLLNEGEYFYKAPGASAEVPINEQQFEEISNDLKVTKAFIAVPLSEYEIMSGNGGTA